MLSRRYIPQELCDEIIDHVWDDMPTLLACATTCRSWVWRSQKNIFRVVSVNNATRFGRFTRLAKSKKRLASYVRVLTLAKARRYKTKMDREWPELLSQLPHIEELTIGRWLDLFPMDSAVRRGLPRYLKHVRVLRIADSFVGSGVDFARLLAACPKMRRLELDNARMWPAPSGDHDDAPKLSGIPELLDTLALSPNHTSGPMLRFLISSPLATSLRKLELELVTPLVFRDCEPFLRATSDTLEELVLSVTGNKVSRRRIAYYVSIPLMKRLRRLHLRAKMADPKEPVPRRYEWMPPFLRMFDTWQEKGSLREVVLSWRTSDLSSMTPLPPWQSFDNALTSLAKRFANLDISLNLLDDTGIEKHLIYMLPFGLQLFPSLQNQQTTLLVNMGRSWHHHDIFGGCLGIPEQFTFKYPQPDIKTART
ncbi:hypothetical protein FOMPIDRAFT_88818 [Fomitopsis schrenkii]|uniref:F-box domain-containing protein n=1 Tax=Fomitopsis schrenkii TaxID=2126942 RepID=S8EBZ5_FOMSC|nr:hypothetical protein FOMPIDRAFT_88818 [Fomitopsis schrenkii]